MTKEKVNHGMKSKLTLVRRMICLYSRVSSFYEVLVFVSSIYVYIFFHKTFYHDYFSFFKMKENNNNNQEVVCAWRFKKISMIQTLVIKDESRDKLYMFNHRAWILILCSWESSQIGLKHVSAKTFRYFFIILKSKFILIWMRIAKWLLSQSFWFLSTGWEMCSWREISF